jgi:SAM-dependent methyltransferase
MIAHFVPDEPRIFLRVGCGVSAPGRFRGVELSETGKLASRLRREVYQPSWLGAILRPDYIIRGGLFRTIRSLAPSIEGVVLDFGCGSRPYQELFTGATRYIGVDLEVSGHDHSDSRVDVFYDGKTLPFPDETFDAVLSFEVFEHVFNLSDLLAEIRRVTKPHGTLLISLPFAWHEHEQPYDFARYTSFGIKHLLSESGYEVVQLEKTTTHILATFQMFIAYLTLIRPRARILRLLRQVCLIFPCTVLAYVLSGLLPKRDEYFCNLVLKARKAE